MTEQDRFSNPKVSVVMPVFNGERFLHEAVGSILDQSFRDFEFIIIDDGSTDATAAILESYLRRDARVKVYRQENRGIVESLNSGYRIARGEYIARMDADDVSAPARLERQVAFLDTHPLVGLVGCGKYDNIDVTGAALYTTYLPEDNESIQSTLVQRWCFLHPSIIFRRALIDIVGLYRREFEGAEDHDFILRLLEHCQAHNLQERLISYRLNPKGLSITYHQYMNDLGEVAMRLARRRRGGESEDLEREVARLRELKCRRKPPGGLAGAAQLVRDSLYAANRYYGFGCRELCAGRLDRARRCFVRSLRTNCLFVKSWVGIGLSLAPFAASRLRFLFRSSMQERNDAAGRVQATSVVSGT
ncbi:MAG TPA: glycosyltransferase [Terriglobales bacterium]|nr:glycosyltransferase [Terriglobales bacterium]